jgi:hypothetical protein
LCCRHARVSALKKVAKRIHWRGEALILTLARCWELSTVTAPEILRILRNRASLF